VVGFFASGRKKMEFLTSESPSLQHLHTVDFHSSLVEQQDIYATRWNRHFWKISLYCKFQ